MTLPHGVYDKEIMADYSIFKSRKTVLTCNSEDFFNFTTDIRNFSRFVRDDYIREWEATTDTCRIRIPHIGEVHAGISEKIPYSLVRYSGSALQNNEFHIDAEISENKDGRAEIYLTVRAGLNPVLKMMASGLIEKFLDSLVDEMENFRDWKVT